MSDFVKPSVEQVSDRVYIQALLDITLHKDLCKDEEICPWCHGTALVITNNPYGLEGDPDRKAGLFPYKHQSITFCPHCYNGVIHRCELCGEIMPKGRLKHDCEQQRTIDRKSAAEKERQEMGAAKEYLPEALDDFLMCYYGGYPHDNGYFMDWDSFFDWWDSEFEGELERPEFVWGTEKVEMSMDADSIIEDATQDLYEDAEDNISGEERKKLQSLLNDWCANCGVGTTYMESHKSKVRIPWDMYTPSKEAAQCTTT